MKKIIEDLQTLEREIESAKKDKAIQEGRYQEALKRLKELGHDSLASAEEALAEMQQKKGDLSAKAQVAHKNLREKYDW